MEGFDLRDGLHADASDAVVARRITKQHRAVAQQPAAGVEDIDARAPLVDDDEGPIAVVGFLHGPGGDPGHVVRCAHVAQIQLAFDGRPGGGGCRGLGDRRTWDGSLSRGMATPEGAAKEDVEEDQGDGGKQRALAQA
jgi:hypothetical protein